MSELISRACDYFKLSHGTDSSIYGAMISQEAYDDILNSKEADRTVTIIIGSVEKMHGNDMIHVTPSPNMDEGVVELLYVGPRGFYDTYTYTSQFMPSNIQAGSPGLGISRKGAVTVVDEILGICDRMIAGGTTGIYSVTVSPNTHTDLGAELGYGPTSVPTLLRVAWPHQGPLDVYSDRSADDSLVGVHYIDKQTGLSEATMVSRNPGPPPQPAALVSHWGGVTADTFFGGERGGGEVACTHSAYDDPGFGFRYCKSCDKKQRMINFKWSDA